MAINSLGRIRYYSALQYVSAVIGNSSSGIIEVPSFGIPTLNIGDRQKGRIASNSVVHCSTAIEDIKSGLLEVTSQNIRSIASKKLNPYYLEDTTNRIVEILKEYPLKQIIQKKFYNTKQ